ncbi:hypothetical protein FRB97_001563, partial [Tulasnella sp. 331]
AQMESLYREPHVNNVPSLDRPSPKFCSISNRRTLVGPPSYWLQVSAAGLAARSAWHTRGSTADRRFTRYLKPRFLEDSPPPIKDSLHQAHKPQLTCSSIGPPMPNMLKSMALLSVSLFAVVKGQGIGTNQAETHPSLSWSKCTTSGGCVSSAGSVVLDANWRWPTAILATNGTRPSAPTRPLALPTANSTVPPTPPPMVSPAAATPSPSSSSREATNTAYQMFKPLNQEFTFTVDLSTLPCGLNGALYFSEMAADGGSSAHPTNRAGAQYGTRYCDSQCPHDIKSINGAANLLDWNATSANSGTGMYGSCCSEMDIWEANSIAAAYTPHPCTSAGLLECSGSTCTSTCDQAGSDFNSYRWGDTSEIRRLYIQNGVTIQNSVTNIPGLTTYDSISDASCKAQKTATGDTDMFETLGGMAEMGQRSPDAKGSSSLSCVRSVDMLWLDGDYPTTASATAPGVARGTCATSSGKPATVKAAGGNVQVIYSDIRFGDIGSTYTGAPYAPPGTTSSSTTTKTGTTSSSTTTKTSGTTTSKAPTSTTSTSGATQTEFGQCGGIEYT